MFGFIINLTHPVTRFCVWAIHQCWTFESSIPLRLFHAVYCQEGNWISSCRVCPRKITLCPLQIASYSANKFSKVYKWLSCANKHQIRIWEGWDKGWIGQRLEGEWNFIFVQDSAVVDLLFICIVRPSAVNDPYGSNTVIGWICFMQKGSCTAYDRVQWWGNTTEAWKMKPS